MHGTDFVDSVSLPKRANVRNFLGECILQGNNSFNVITAGYQSENKVHNIENIVYGKLRWAADPMPQNSRLSSIIREHFPHLDPPQYAVSDESSSISFMNFEVVALHPHPEHPHNDHSPPPILDNVVAEALELVINNMEENRKKKQELKRSELEKVACSHMERVKRKKAVKKRIDEFLTRAQAQNNGIDVTEKEPCFIDAVDGDVGRDIRKFLFSSGSPSGNEMEDGTPSDAPASAESSPSQVSDGEDKACDLAQPGNLSAHESSEDNGSGEPSVLRLRSELASESCSIMPEKTGNRGNDAFQGGFLCQKGNEEICERENKLPEHTEVLAELNDSYSLPDGSIKVGCVVENETTSAQMMLRGAVGTMPNDDVHNAENEMLEPEIVRDIDIESSNQCSTPGYYDQEMLEEQIELEKRKKELQKVFADVRPKNGTKVYFDKILGIVSEIGYTEALRRICDFYLFRFPEYEIFRENCVYVCTASFAGIDFLSPYVFDKVTAKECSSQRVCDYLSENWHLLFTS